jgi:deoxyinosine 3'endonuclease (endonuclease V)
MQNGGYPARGVFVAVDVQYLASGGARAAAVVAADAAFSRLVAERTELVPDVAPYRPGQFYLRELPPMRAVLEGLSEMALLVVDGYADLDPDGKPGLGAHACAEFAVPVIGASHPGRAPRLRNKVSSIATTTGSPAGTSSITTSRAGLGNPGVSRDPDR